MLVRRDVSPAGIGSLSHPLIGDRRELRGLDAGGGEPALGIWSGRSGERRDLPGAPTVVQGSAAHAQEGMTVPDTGAGPGLRREPSETHRSE